MKILIAPLDWGLGHTTRCIPIIRYLKEQGHKVYAAAEGASARLLSDNFPGIKILPLAGYRISYGSNRKTFSLKILLQVPKILSAIKGEHLWLLQQQEIHRFDLIISDNRYGLHLADIPSVILTHQLQIKSGMGFWADDILRRMHYKMLNRFRQCWVVDEDRNNGISGSLAHPQTLPTVTKYIGLLSQFSGSVLEHKDFITNRILVLLSGPEPMRSQLEALILLQAIDMPSYQFIIVAGNPLGKRKNNLPEGIIYHTHLNAVQLLPELERAAMVVCRSGYSTIMDLVVLGKKALLIPTPGQTEQEYLARYLSDKNYFQAIRQEDLQLATQVPLTLAAGCHPVKPDNSNRMETLLRPFIGPAVYADKE